MTDLVEIREVGLRDGLQLVKEVLATEVKLEWCRLQADCNFREMEVTSFVPPSVIPQFADSAEVLAGARTIKDMRAAVLVPNLKWGLRALDHGAEKITFVLSVSERHNQANVRRSTDQSISEFAQLVKERDSRGSKSSVALSAAMATTFGCCFEGDVAESRVYQVVEEVLKAGCDELNMCDTVGFGNPVQVKRMLSEILKQAGEIPVAAHFHDTRGMGLANAVAAVEAGVRRFDSSLGGLGGCPFATGASGNIATEDCVYLMENLGLTTGVDLGGMLAVRAKMDQWLPNEPLEGKLLKAGAATNFRGN